jgi:translation initiation factor 6 (eIF-6)
MEFVMTRLLAFVAAASLFSVTAQTALTQEAHEQPDPQPGTSEVVKVEVEAGRVNSAYDLASSGLAATDKISVTSFASSGVIDGSSRGDY